MNPSTGDFSDACINDNKNLYQTSESYFEQNKMLDWTMAKMSGKLLYSCYL